MFPWRDNYTFTKIDQENFHKNIFKANINSDFSCETVNQYECVFVCVG